MATFRSSVTASLILSFLFGSIHAVPLVEKLGRLSVPARDLLKRTTPAPPYFLAYNDKWLNPLPSASDLVGFNAFALTFLLASGSVDEAQNWQGLTASQRSSYLSEYNAAGISLIVSAFGSTETPTSSGFDPVNTANSIASWVTTYGVLGVDVDYEDFTAFNSGNGAAETWLISFTKQLRTRLPLGEYILTHAPVAPWFSPGRWTGGGYLAIDKSVGSLIDWYNVQFYNQGATEYTTCAGLLTASSSVWPETALFQISANGVSLDKLVIGKPGTTADASNGYIDPSTLATCVAQAASKGWDAGVMVWQYPDVTSSWIKTVRGSTFPVSGSPSPSPSPTTTTTTSMLTSTTSMSTTSPLPTGTTTSPAPTSTGTPGSCSGVSAWVNNIAYTTGNHVTYNGNLWTANQWNEDETPGGPSGAWTYDGACSTGTATPTATSTPLTTTAISTTAMSTSTTATATPTTTTATSTTTAIPTNTTATSTTTAATPSPTSCAGASAWVNNVAYITGNQVTYVGDLWTANQWNEDETPGGPSGAWTYDIAC